MFAHASKAFRACLTYSGPQSIARMRGAVRRTTNMLRFCQFLLVGEKQFFASTVQCSQLCFFRKIHRCYDMPINPCFNRICFCSF